MCHLLTVVNRDAGLLLAAFLDSSSASTGDSELGLPECLKTLLSKEKFEVLELGTGCGIVGITMAKRFSNAQILITDMSEAEEIARHNISMITGQTHTDRGFANIAYQNLDWEERLPENLRNGNLDLVLVADCTYNSDVVPDLVETLADLVKYNQDVVILVAMKIRHDSEMAFFELMRKTNIVSLDELVLPLPLLGQDAEEIELHFFKGG
jgi:predicted nicotinamide N-methyase